MPNNIAQFDVSQSWGTVASPQLSILIPTYDHDVMDLCHELLADMATLHMGAVELLVLIDGNPALEGQHALITSGDIAGLPVALAMATVNLGRSMARNTLARLARGRFLMFLDADSLPDAPCFVGRALAALGSPDVVLCGGRTGLRHTAPPLDARLFHLHSKKREWIAASERNQDPAGCFLSANFIVARDLFLASPFDENFKAWGWEDTEWAIRVSRGSRIHHFDNSVSHMEHHKDNIWLGRLERAAPNYARLYELYPKVVGRHRIFLLIYMLRTFSGCIPLAWLLRHCIFTTFIPAGLRLSFLKFLQALHYTRVIHNQPIKQRQNEIGESKN